MVRASATVPRRFAERGVRYLDCEGGQTVLGSLHAAGLLDEVFAEGRIAPASAWRFRRWRFNQR